MEAKLDPTLRPHPPLAIVNTDRIKELQPLFHGEYIVTCATGQGSRLSRGYREKLSGAARQGILNGAIG